MSINWASYIISSLEFKKVIWNVASVIFVSKLKMEIWLGSKCHKQTMSNLTSKLSLLSSWRITRMELEPESSCRLSNWCNLDAHTYQHFRKRGCKRQSLFVELYLAVLEWALHPPTLLVLKSRSGTTRSVASRWMGQTSDNCIRVRIGMAKKFVCVFL